MLVATAGSAEECATCPAGTASGFKAEERPPRNVVVKVQYPQSKDCFRSYIRSLSQMARLLKLSLIHI